MKKLVTLTVGALLFAASGCTSTVTLGPSANEDAVVGVSAGQNGAAVTVPFVNATVAPSEATTAPTEITTPKK